MSQKDELFKAIAAQDEAKMVEVLNADPGLVGATTFDGYSPIHKCAKQGTASMMHKLIKDFKADVDVRAEGLNTAAIIAADYDNIACLAELVKAGANTELSNQGSRDPLSFLAENHHEIAIFNKEGSVLIFQDEHLAVKLGDGNIFSLHDILEC